MHRVVIHLCSPLLCQTYWLQRQLLKDGIILITIFVGIVSVQHQVLTISLSHGIVTMPELVYRMLVTLLYVSKQWGYVSHNNVRSNTPKVAVFPISFTKTIYTISTQLHMTNVRSDVGTGPYIVSYSNNQMSILFNIEHSGVIMDGAWWLVIGR